MDEVDHSGSTPGIKIKVADSDLHACIASVDHHTQLHEYKLLVKDRPLRNVQSLENIILDRID